MISDAIYDLKEKSDQKLSEGKADNHSLTKAEELCASLGKKSCLVLSKLQEKSDAHRTYYTECKNKGTQISVKDHILNAVNCISRGIGYGTSFAANTAMKAGKAIANSDSYGKIKNMISKGYNSVGEYMAAKASDLSTQKSKEKTENQFVSLSTGFKSFINQIGRTIHSAAGYGVSLAGRAGVMISNSAKEVKKSDAYAKLQSRKEELDKQDDELVGDVAYAR